MTQTATLDRLLLEGRLWRLARNAVLQASPAGVNQDRRLAGWNPADSDFFDRRLVSEWFCDSLIPRSGAHWRGPVTVLLGLAGLFRARRSLRGQSDRSKVLCVGKHVWPDPGLLDVLLMDGCRGPSPPDPDRYWRDCILVDPPDRASRIWAIHHALRCPEICAVLADGAGLDLSASRRVLLAAESSGTYALLARPIEERSKLSAAGSRWLVEPMPSDTGWPRWSVHLLSCKGLQPDMEHSEGWSVSWNGDSHDLSGAVCFSPFSADRSTAKEVTPRSTG